MGRLIACDNCDCCELTDQAPCSHGQHNHKLVEVLREYPHPDPTMETPCYEVRVVGSEVVMDEIRMWDLVRPAPLEQLALEAE